MEFNKPNGTQGDLETNSGLLNFPTAYDYNGERRGHPLPRVGVVRCSSELGLITHHTVNMSNQGLFFFDPVSSTQFS